MRVKARFLGREAVMRRLVRLVPDAQKELAAAQMEAAQELATAIARRAPRDTGEYADSIQADLLSNRSNRRQVGVMTTKDENATGIYASFKWRFLEFGTKASPARASRQDRRYRRTAIMTKSYRAHAATRAFPHIFPTYRAMRKKLRRKVAGAVNKAIRRARGA